MSIKYNSQHTVKQNLPTHHPVIDYPETNVQSHCSHPKQYRINCPYDCQGLFHFGAMRYVWFMIEERIRYWWMDGCSNPRYPKSSSQSPRRNNNLGPSGCWTWRKWSVSECIIICRLKLLFSTAMLDNRQVNKILQWSKLARLNVRHAVRWLSQ